MSNFSKIVVTIIAIIIFLAAFLGIMGMREMNGYSTPGFFGIIIGFGLIAGLKAIWKSDETNSDEITLDKD